MQLGEAEGAELGQRAAETGQLARLGTGREQQAGDALLLVLQRQAEQAAPRFRAIRQETRSVQIAVQFAEAQGLVLAPTILQQMLTVIIARQTGGLAWRQTTVVPLG